MKVLILGGGPAGLYLAILLKKANPAHNITILERNPRSATYGWGVVFSDRTLASFREADYKTYKEMTDRFVQWESIDTWYRGEVIRCGGNIFAGISRRVLLNILQSRCEELEVKLKFQTDITDLAQLPAQAGKNVDLIVAADGVNSLVRQTYAHIFKPDLEIGKAKYIWLGTDKVFDAFTFIFEENEHGLFQVHAYPFDGQTGTFIVECEEAVWQRAGLDQASEAESIAYCEKLFARNLGGHKLMSNNSKWINFVRVKNKHWRCDNIILLGDAAHTAHFSIGSGTKLAMEDSIALANAFEHQREVISTLNDYELERRPKVEALQAAARESRVYFENISHTLYLEPLQFTFHLMTRSGRLGYDDLRQRDPAFVAAVDRRLASATSEQAAGQADAPALGSSRLGGTLLAPPPMFNPLPLRQLTLANRIVMAAEPTYTATDGLPGSSQSAQIYRLALAGAGLVMTETVAVSAQGRITPGDLGLYQADQIAAWKAIVEFVHTNSQAKIGLLLNHAGRRASTRPRQQGLDKPLRAGNWPLLAASAVPYMPKSQVPKAMDRVDMESVRQEFVQAAQAALAVGFDLLQLHLGHGYLLASFISPLTNQRNDDYGGSLENRLRFPVEVLQAVRAVWPEDKPLAIALNTTDCAPGGVTLEDAVAIANIVKTHRCDLVEILAGQTTLEANPAYQPGFLTNFSDWVRSKSHVITLVGGNLTSTDEVNTIVASGRADLCLMRLNG